MSQKTRAGFNQPSIRVAIDPCKAVRRGGFAAEKIADGFFTIVFPAKYGGIDEGKQADGKNQRAYGGNGFKRGFCKGRALKAILPQTCAYYHKTRQQTYYHRVPERAGKRNERLPHWMFCLSRRRDYGRASKAGFIGKKSSRYAVAHCLFRARSDKAAYRGMSSRRRTSLSP